MILKHYLRNLGLLLWFMLTVLGLVFGIFLLTTSLYFYEQAIGWGFLIGGTLSFAGFCTVLSGG